MVFADSLGVQSILVESDCLDLIKACREEVKRGVITTLIKDILSIKSKLQRIGFTWVPREGNQVAHQIALLASHNCLPVNWTRSPPSCLLALIQKDQHVLNRDGIRQNDLDRSLNHLRVSDQGLPLRLQVGVLSRSGFPFDNGWNKVEFLETVFIAIDTLESPFLIC